LGSAVLIFSVFFQEIETVLSFLGCMIDFLAGFNLKRVGRIEKKVFADPFWMRALALDSPQVVGIMAFVSFPDSSQVSPMALEMAICPGPAVLYSSNTQ